MPDQNLVGRLRYSLHERRKLTRVTRYAEGRAYASPVTLSGLNYDQAAALGAQPAMRKWSNSWAHAIAKHAGLGVHAHRAIGDWSPPGHPEWAGAEPSTEFHFHNARDMDHIRYVASLIGKHANQIQVLPFQEQKGGPHSMYHMHVPHANPHKIREQLDQAGLQHRTLVPGSGHTRVVVYDQGDDPSVADKINHVARQFGSVQPHRIRGIGEFHPNVPEGDSDAQRKAAQPLYDKYIHEYEHKHSLKPFSPPGIQKAVTAMQGDPMQYARRPAPGQGKLPLDLTKSKDPRDPDGKKRKFFNDTLEAKGYDPDTLESKDPKQPGPGLTPQAAAQLVFQEFQHQHPGSGSVYMLDKPRVRIAMEPAKREGAKAGSQDAYNNGLIDAAKRRRDPNEKRALLQKAAGSGAGKPVDTPPAAPAAAPTGEPPAPTASPAAPAKPATASKPFAGSQGAPAPRGIGARVTERAKVSPAGPGVQLGSNPAKGTVGQIPQGELYPPGMHPAQTTPSRTARLPLAVDSPHTATNRLSGRVPLKPTWKAAAGAAPPKMNQPIALPASRQYPATPAPQPGRIAGFMNKLDSPQTAMKLAGGLSKIGEATGIPKLLSKVGVYEKPGRVSRYAGQPKFGNSPAAMMDPPAPSLPKPTGYTPGVPTEGLGEHPQQQTKGPLGRSPGFLNSLGKPQQQDPSDSAYHVMSHQGHIVVVSHDGKQMHVVDARNPLDDADLVRFHRNWRGAPSIAQQVESHASQHRRMISADANIHTMPPSPLGKVLGTPTEELMRGQMGAQVLRANAKKQAKPAATPAAAPGGQFPGRTPNPYAERPVPMKERHWQQ